jgi:hypothetical protein
MSRRRAHAYAVKALKAASRRDAETQGKTELRESLGVCRKDFLVSEQRGERFFLVPSSWFLALGFSGVRAKEGNGGREKRGRKGQAHVWEYGSVGGKPK